ncbi:YolD-like family protein [Chengkuizengella sp. SCS-71B]|uniref:YolD-like family protein n=1 Tax=Chengkuizengella sp. SCS-71B TaxID=3115290 RepID=UPI0032C24242
MKENKLTPGSNMLWESSRMMLPEHVERINEFQHELTRKTKPKLAEEERNIISEQLSQSMMEEAEITIELFTSFGKNEFKTGTVTKFDTQLKQIKLEFESEYEWIKFDDIVGVS